MTGLYALIAGGVKDILNIIDDEIRDISSD
jgi:hypothetical protein